MATFRYVYTDGKPVPTGICVNPDNYVTEFTVRVRSLKGIGPRTIKDILQTKLEVIGDPKLTACTVVCK